MSFVAYKLTNVLRAYPLQHIMNVFGCSKEEATAFKRHRGYLMPPKTCSSCGEHNPSGNVQCFKCSNQSFSC